MEIREIPRGKLYEGDELIKLLGALVPMTHMDLPSPPVEIVAGRIGEVSKTFSQVKIIGGTVVADKNGLPRKVFFETAGPSGLVKFSIGPVEPALKTENVRSLKLL